MSRRPRSPFDREKSLARQAKRSGISREEYVTLRRSGYEKSAKEQGWRPAELAMTLADVTMAAEEVWKARKRQPNEVKQ